MCLGGRLQCGAVPEVSHGHCQLEVSVAMIATGVPARYVSNSPLRWSREYKAYEPHPTPRSISS